MAMQQSLTIEERILYWLSLDLEAFALAERLLERFAVTHTLDCLTHSANAPQIRKPTSGNDLQGGSTVMSFRIRPLSVDLAASGQTQHVPELDEEQGSDNIGDTTPARNVSAG